MVRVSPVRVCGLVAELKLDLRDALAHAFLSLAYNLGQDAQVDFCDAAQTARFAGGS